MGHAGPWTRDAGDDSARGGGGLRVRGAGLVGVGRFAQDDSVEQATADANCKGNTGDLRCAQDDGRNGQRQEHGNGNSKIQGSFTSFRMTAWNGQRQEHGNGNSKIQGSFTSFRMTAWNGQQQEQRQRQRQRQNTGVLHFVQDDGVKGMADEDLDWVFREGEEAECRTE